MNRRRTVVRVGLVLGALMGAWACDGGGMVAGMMGDAGELLVDAGEAVRDAADQLRDSSGNDASAQVPISMEIPCDVVRTETRRQIDRPEPGQSQEQRWTYRYAELHDVAVDPMTARAVAAFGCGWSDAVPTSPSCVSSPGAIECTGDPDLPGLGCRTLEAQVEAGLVRVRCGAELATRHCDSFPSTCDPWVTSAGGGVDSVRVTVFPTDP